MKLKLDNSLKYNYSNIRQFFPHEKHMDRVFHEDVLLLVFKGILRFKENGENIEVKANEYYIQRAGLKQEGTVESDVPNYYYIHFNGTFDENGDLPIKGTFNPDAIEPFINELVELSFDSIKISYYKNFYGILFELYKGQHANDTADTIKDYLNKHYKESIKLEDIGKIVYLSKNQIINIFKKAYGKTPHKYITDLRLDNACELILSTNRSIDDIAESVGYNDYSIFYKSFCKRYNVSPLDYRKLMANKDLVLGTNPPK